MDGASPRPNAPGASPVAPQAESSSAGNLCALKNYRILRSIGAGGMSEVYLAYDAQLGRQVAVKVLSDRLVGNQTFVNRFMREGRLGKELTHPNLVKAHACECDAASGKCFIAMEFIDGLTAQELLERDGRIPVAKATAIIVDIARALEYLHHRRYVHRDIKPGNILVGPDGVARLIDLGVAKQLENANVLTTLDQGVGTPYYMPWEQSMNSGLVDARSDIFALGATFYHLLTGHVPFPGDDEATISRNKTKGDFIPVRQHNRKLPALLDPILDRMLARDPRKRFSSARDVVEVLTASGLIDGRQPAELEPSVLVPQPLAPTRADLQSQSDVDTPLETGSDQVWLVKFQRPEDGSWRKVHARTPDVIRLYEEGVLPDEVYAARQPSKVFRNLKAYPEFRNVNRRSQTGKPKPAGTNPLRQPRRQAVAPSRTPWGQYLGSMVVTGVLTLLLCFSVAVVMRLMGCL
jgi:serine/threonine-protein kinase